jgi:CheY-like chemotaxis protein
MSSPQCTTSSETVSSILFAHAADEELKNLILPCLQGFPEIFTAESGSEAVRQQHAKQPCIVVASLEQGDMTGFDLCSRIKEANPEVQIILVGREPGEAVYKRVMAAGAVRYLVMDDDNAPDSLKMLVDEQFSLCEARRKERGEADMLRSQIAVLTKNEEKLATLAIERTSAFELIALLDGGISDIRELKSLARFLSVSAEPEARPFALRALISSLQSALSIQLSGHGKEIFVMVPAYVPNHFLGNSSAIECALSCLLGSALENCDGGRITLKADMKEKSGSGTVIQLSVDFSCILTPTNRFASIREYLTDRTADAHAPQKAGLSLAAALVERLGGEMWVKSLMNHSTTYYVSLCLFESSAAVAGDSGDAGEQTAATKPDSYRLPGFNSVSGTKSTGRPRILLADDNEVDQLTICRLLESMNYDVIRVSNGREAVEEFDGSSCDAVLMDILMPEMDGFEATRMIREKERLVGGGHTPIIALTSYSLKAIHEKCVSVGMDSYLHKPVSAQDIKTLFSSSIAAETVTAVGLNDSLIERLPLLDMQETLENLADNVNLYREIMELFTANIPSNHQDLLTAIRSGVLVDVVHHAHTIKGMSSNVGAKRYAELNRQLQDAALDGDMGAPERWLHRLSVELPRLQAVIAEVDWQKLH